MIQWGTYNDTSTKEWSDEYITFASLGLKNYTTNSYSIFITPIASSGDDKVEVSIVKGSVTKGSFAIRRYSYANYRGCCWFTIGM